MKLTFVLSLALCVILAGCRSPQSSYSPSSSASDSGELTTEKAQNAIDRFASANGSGKIRIKGGVQEVPAQNAAIAKVDIDDFTDKKGRNIRGKDAVAKFTHYTDGRWVLTDLEFSLGPWNGSVKLETQISVQ